MRVYVTATPDEWPVVRAVTDRLSAQGHDVFSPDMLIWGEESSPSSSLIRTADAVVAILDSPHPNLMFELGLAVGSNRLLVVAASKIPTLPLDVASVPYVSLVGDVDHDSAAIARMLTLTGDDVLMAAPPSVPPGLRPKATLEAIIREPELTSIISASEFEGLVSGFISEQFSVLVRPPQPQFQGTYDFEFDSQFIEGTVLCETKRQPSSNRVSVSAVLKLAGAVEAARANRGLIVTSSGFTMAARGLADELPVTLRTVEEILDAGSEHDLLGLR